MASRSSSTSSSPHSPCSSDNKREFRPLLLFGQKVPLHRRREPTLGAQRQVLEWNITRCFVNAARQHVGTFEFGPFRTDQAKHDLLVAGNKTERIKGPRAGVVVLEQEAIDGNRIEELLSYLVVAAFGVPVTPIV